jgi:hypothetical protein
MNQDKIEKQKRDVLTKIQDIKSKIESMDKDIEWIDQSILYGGIDLPTDDEYRDFLINLRVKLNYELFKLIERLNTFRRKIILA